MSSSLPVLVRFAVIAGCISMAACGLKDDLYLPDPPSEAEAAEQDDTERDDAENS